MNLEGYIIVGLWEGRNQAFYCGLLDSFLPLTKTQVSFLDIFLLPNEAKLFEVQKKYEQFVTDIRLVPVKVYVVL